MVTKQRTLVSKLQHGFGFSDLVGVFTAVSAVYIAVRIGKPESIMWAIISLLLPLRTAWIISADHWDHSFEIIDSVAEALRVASIALSMGMIIVLLRDEANSVSLAIRQNLGNTSLVGTGFLFGVGYGLFWLKAQHLMWYAVLEIGFGLASSWVAVQRAKTHVGLPEFIVVVGATYLISRGLENQRKARDERGQSLRHLLPWRLDDWDRVEAEQKVNST